MKKYLSELRVAVNQQHYSFIQLLVLPTLVYVTVKSRHCTIFSPSADLTSEPIKHCITVYSNTIYIITTWKWKINIDGVDQEEWSMQDLFLELVLSSLLN